MWVSVCVDEIFGLFQPFSWGLMSVSVVFDFCFRVLILDVVEDVD